MERFSVLINRVNSDGGVVLANVTLKQLESGIALFYQEIYLKLVYQRLRNVIYLEHFPKGSEELERTPEVPINSQPLKLKN